MKFEYDGDSEQRECVAYIVASGELVVRNIDNGNAICMGPYGSAAYVSNITRFDPSDATRKFYPGDKVTITF